jgi:hypothetical protein
VPPITDFTNITFTVEDGHLVMTAVAGTSAAPYRHACPLASYEAVAHALAEAGPGGITRAGLHERTGIPWTRIQVALLFLLERSIVERAGRRGRLYVPASRVLFESAMVEYHALREGEAPDADDAWPRCPGCGAEQRGQPVTDPDGRRVCGECGHAWDEDPGS